MSSTSGETPLSEIKQELEHRLPKRERLWLEAEIANGDTVKTGVAIAIGHIAAQYARNEIVRPEVEHVESLLSVIDDPRVSLELFRTYNHLGLLLYDAIKTTPRRAAIIGDNTYYVHAPVRERVGLFMSTGEGIDPDTAERIHSHDRRSILPDLTRIAVHHIREHDGPATLEIDALESLSELGYLAQLIARDTVELVGKLPKTKRSKRSVQKD